MSVFSLRADDDTEDVIERYSDMVYGIALVHVRNQADAQDVLQEVFFAYCRYRGEGRGFREEEHRKAWLIRTALNCSRRVTAGSWRRRVVPLEEAPDSPVTFSCREENLVYAAVLALPDKYRTPLYLFYFEDLSVEQISRITHIRQGTVRMQLTRARELLRTQLKGEYFDE